VTEREESGSAADIEELLCEAWANVLGVPPNSIGAGDSFFDVGGDSIGANLVVSLLSARGLDLEVVDIFEHPTIEALSDLLRTRRGASLSTGDGEARKDEFVRLDLHLNEFRWLEDGYTDERDLEEALLTALGMALRMLTGAAAFTVVVENVATASHESTMSRFTLRIPDINDCLSNLASARAGRRGAVSYDEAEDDILPGEHTSHGMAVSFVRSAEDRPAPDTLRAICFAPTGRRPEGVTRIFLRVCCCISPTSLVLDLAGADQDGDSAALAVVAENLRFALRQIDAAVGEERESPVAVRAGTSSWPRHVRHEVRPYNDVVLMDCNHQALAAVMSSFGRDATLLAANLCATYELDDEHQTGVGVRHSYVAAMPTEELLRRSGVAVEAATGDSDPCDTVISRLATGALAIVQADCYYLESRKHFFGTRHAQDSFLVFGYDLSERRFDVIENDSVEAATYRTGSIGFDDLRDAHLGYRRLFDPARKEAGLLIASKIAGATPATGDRKREQLTLDAMRAADVQADESLAALARLSVNLSRILMSRDECLRSLHQVHFLVGKILQGRRLEAFKLGVVLQDLTLAGFLAETVEDLEYVVNVLTKMKISGVYAERGVPALLARVENVVEHERRYVDMRKRLLEVSRA
jgi:aryl carrier-like protein